MLTRKSKVPGDKPLTAGVYRFCTQKVISFIATEGAGIKKSGFQYLSNYPKMISNVNICPDVCPLVI